MGQQQLLLISIGILIVAIAIALGIALFQTGYSTSTRDAIVNDLTYIAAYAQQHYVRPLAMGGGGGSFLNFSLPELKRNNPVAEYTASPDGTNLELVGTSITNENIIITLTLSFGDNGWIYDWDWVHEGL